MHQHFKFFCKYWTDDGLLRPKLVANIRITIKYYIVVSDGLHMKFNFINDYARLIYVNISVKYGQPTGVACFLCFCILISQRTQLI
jgi:hypothetical protein